MTFRFLENRRLLVFDDDDDRIPARQFDDLIHQDDDNVIPHNGTFLPPSNESIEEDNNTVSLILLLWLFIFISCVARLRNEVTSPEELQEQSREEERERRRKDPDWRKHLLEKSLLTKKVISCNQEEKQITLGSIDKHASGGDTEFDSDDAESTSLASIDSYDDESLSCVICLEPFEVGDLVSFPPQNTGGECRHVFHTECISSWLLSPQHDDCPSCRTTLLHHEDEENEAVDNTGVVQFPSPLRRRRSSVFVISDGLVRRLSRQAGSLRRVSSSILRRLSSGRVSHVSNFTLDDDSSVLSETSSFDVATGDDKTRAISLGSVDEDHHQHADAHYGQKTSTPPPRGILRGIGLARGHSGGRATYSKLPSSFTSNDDDDSHDDIELGILRAKSSSSLPLDESGAAEVPHGDRRVLDDKRPRSTTQEAYRRPLLNRRVSFEDESAVSPHQPKQASNASTIAEEED